MMESESHGFVGEARLYASKEEMESLVLDDPLNDNANSRYRSAAVSFSPSSAASDPLNDNANSRYRSAAVSFSSSSAATDPLLAPPPPPPDGSSYLDPPSYADVVFSPFDSPAAAAADPDSPGGISVGESASGFSRSSSAASAAGHGHGQGLLRITVSSPQKEQEASSSLVPGGGTYVTYQITTRTDLPEFCGGGGGGGGEFVVRRRFRDVVTLGDRLAESYRGFFVPPRPDKSVVESQVMQKQEFVEQRRAALEKYLRRLAEHPVIRRSDELRVFLQVQGKMPLPATTDVASRMLDGAAKLPRQLFSESAAAVAPHEAVQPAKGGRDLLRLFRELRQSVANDWGASRPPLVEEDKEFLDRKEKMHDLEHHLSSASQQAESLVKAQQDMGETLGELGLAFIKLTKFENEEAVFNSQRVRAADMKGIATAAVKASRFYRELNAQTVKHLDTLHEYLGLMLAVNGAFADRSSALLTVQTLLSELASLQSRAEKLEVATSKIFGGDKSRTRKLEELQETIKVTEDAKSVATREYERIKENNRNELDRFNNERHADFLNMLKGFVLNQVGYAEKISNVWAKVAEDTSGYARESN